MRFAACAVSLTALTTFAAITFAGQALRSGDRAMPIAQAESSVHEFDFLVGLHALAMAGRRVASPVLAVRSGVEKTVASRPDEASAQIVPPCRSMMRLTMLEPTPCLGRSAPCQRRNGSKRS